MKEQQRVTISLDVLTLRRLLHSHQLFIEDIHCVGPVATHCVKRVLKDCVRGKLAIRRAG